MKIGFIGAGQMAQALAGGIATEKRPDGEPIEFWISDPSMEAIDAFQNRVNELATVHRVDTNSEVIENGQIVFIAVKPQYLKQALEKLDSAILNHPEILVISIVAGVSLGELHRRLQADRIIRVMPNTPCLVGRGAIGLAASEQVTEAELAAIVEMLGHVGIVHQVSEENLDAVTGLSGSGPAYVFTFIEALSDGGVLNGLPRHVATQLALQTVIGAAELMMKSGEHAAVLRDRVTSPGGTTIAGLKAMEETGFRDSVMSAVTAATERSIELGE